MKQKKFDKSIFKMSSEELNQYLVFKRKGYSIQNKKGKGSYKRKPKYPDKFARVA